MFRNHIFIKCSKNFLSIISLFSLVFICKLYANQGYNQVSVREVQSQAVDSCELYAKMQMLSLLEASIKLDGLDKVSDEVAQENNNFKNFVKSKYNSIYKNCVRLSYNHINKVRIGKINEAFEKYKYNYDVNKGYIKSLVKSLDNKALIDKYMDIINKQ